MIGAALLAKAGGAEHGPGCRAGRGAADDGAWLVAITAVAGRVIAVLAAPTAELGVDFLPPAQAAGCGGELVGALARGAVLRR